jgi:hypothetical protein
MNQVIKSTCEIIEKEMITRSPPHLGHVLVCDIGRPLAASLKW